MASAPSYVVRFPLRNPTSEQKSHVLVGITPIISAGGSPPPLLDVELVATDDVKAYVMTLQHSKVTKYKSDSACSDSEWKDCLEALLVDGQPIGDVEAYAQITGDGYLFIHVQKKVSGHTQTLGALKLRRSNAAAETIDMFDWCAESTRARVKLEKDIADLKQKHDDLQKLVAEETAHFEELVRSKREFEAEHDSWLKDLLNEKKLKIRLQEQVLATAHVDQAKLDAVAALSKRRAAAGASRKGKRKAEGLDVDADVDTDDDADKMDIDADPEAEGHDGEMSDVDRTTSGSDTASASASEAEVGPEPEPKKKPGVGMRKDKPKVEFDPDEETASE